MTITELRIDETTPRLAGRIGVRHPDALARLLFETARRHGAFDAADWSDWYAAYTDARAEGRIAEQAARAAAIALQG